MVFYSIGLHIETSWEHRNVLCEHNDGAMRSSCDIFNTFLPCSVVDLLRVWPSDMILTRKVTSIAYLWMQRNIAYEMAEIDIAYLRTQLMLRIAFCLLYVTELVNITVSR